MIKPHRRKPFAISWQLLKESCRFLRANKDLLILPITSLIITLILFGAMLLSGVIEIFYIQPAHLSLIVIAAVFIVCYLILSFVALLFNAALIVCVTERLQGKPAPIRHGLVVALKHYRLLLLWCVINFIVGKLIELLERSHKIFAIIVAIIFGATWLLCTYFVIPMLIFEDLSPAQAIKKSIKLFGKKWRRVVSVTMFLGLILLAIFVAWLLALIYLPWHKALLLEIGLPCLIVLWLIIAIVSTTLTTIVRSALYLTLGRQIMPKNFDTVLLKHALIPASRSNMS